jgi:DNA-binding YbaB/EbfC family protein
MADPFTDMFAQLGGVKAKLEEASKNAAERTATVQVGGGMVSATANGRQEITRVTIDPTALANPDKTMIEDLIVAACNQALVQTKGFVQEEMQKVMGALGLPNMPGFDLSKLFGGGK